MGAFQNQPFIFQISFGRKILSLARPNYLVGFKLETTFFAPFCQSTRVLLHTYLCIRLSFVFVNAQCTSGIMINGLTIGGNQEKWRSFSAKNQASQIGVNSMLRLKGSCQLKWCGRIRIELCATTFWVLNNVSDLQNAKQSPCDKSNLQHQANGELNAGCRESKEDSLKDEMFERIAEMNSVGVSKQNAVYTWKKTKTQVQSQCLSKQRNPAKVECKKSELFYQTSFYSSVANTLLQHFSTTLFSKIFSNTSEQHFPTTLLYSTSLQHSSPTLLYDTLLLQRSSSTLFFSTSSHHIPTLFSNTSLQQSSQHSPPTLFSNACLQLSSPTLLATKAPPQKHNHRNTTTKTPPHHRKTQPHHQQNAKTQPQKHNHTHPKTQSQKKSETQPRPHNHTTTKSQPQNYNHTTTKTQPQKNNHTTTKTQKRKHKDTTTKHNHTITKTQPQKHHHKNTKAQPQKHNRTTTKTQKHNHKNTKTQQKTTQRHHHENTTTPEKIAFYHSFKCPTRMKWQKGCSGT